MKFDAGDSIDEDHCTVLVHEFLRCDDSFKEFAKYARQMIMQGKTREISYKTYNAYTSFLHHLYEFISGCLAREVHDTEITNKKGEQRALIIDSYVMHHAQRIMDSYRDDIKNGTAPSWVNHISCYDVTVPADFAKNFRLFRNKVIGHVDHRRASNLSLSEFYSKYHDFIYLLYKDSIYQWGRRDGEFPDLKEITDFSVLITEEGI